jgi:hypothetical protein
MMSSQRWALQYRGHTEGRDTWEPGQVRPSGFAVPFAWSMPGLQPVPDLAVASSEPRPHQAAEAAPAATAVMDPPTLRPILPPEPPLWSDAGLARLQAAQRQSAADRPRRRKRRAAPATALEPWQQAITLERPRVRQQRRHGTLATACGMGIGMGMVTALLGLLLILAAMSGPLGTLRMTGSAPGQTSSPAGAIATIVYTALNEIPGLGEAHHTLASPRAHHPHP